MAKNQDITIEGSIPVVLSNGLNTNKAVDFSGSPSVNLPVNTVIAGVGNLVDTSSVQTLTNKTLANPTTITGAVISGSTIGTSTVNGVTLSSTGSSSLFLNQAGGYVSVSASTANALASATTTVNVSASPAPTVGQVLTATSSTAATWQSQHTYASFYVSPTLPTGTLNGSYNTVSWGVAGDDTASGWNGTNTYTIPFSGRYTLSTMVAITNTAQSGAYVSISFLINGTTRISEFIIRDTNTLSHSLGTSVSSYNFTVGDTVVVQIQDNNTGGAFLNASGFNLFSINKIN